MYLQTINPEQNYKQHLQHVIIYCLVHYLQGVAKLNNPTFKPLMESLPMH